MTLEDLQTDWADDKRQDQAAVDAQRVLTLCRKTAGVGQKLVRRNVKETLAAVFLVVAFGRDFFIGSDWKMQVVSGFIIAWAVFVVARLWLTRRIDAAAQDESMTGYFSAELKRMDAEVRMSKTVLYWYALPCLVACNLYFWATGASVWMSAIYLVVTAGFGAWIQLINKRTADRKLMPVRDELAALLNELETIETDAG